MADECIRHSKRELLLALAERLDQVLWCLLTATDPGCNEKARNRAALEAQKFAQEADGLLHGCDCPPRANDLADFFPTEHGALPAWRTGVEALRLGWPLMKRSPARFGVGTMSWTNRAALGAGGRINGVIHTRDDEPHRAGP